MHTYILLWSHDCTVETFYFKSNKEGIDGLTFGGEEFAKDLDDAESMGMDRDEFEESHEGWTFVQSVIEKFGLDFDPWKEDVMIDMVPDDIDMEIS